MDVRRAVCRSFAPPVGCSQLRIDVLSDRLHAAAAAYGAPGLPAVKKRVISSGLSLMMRKRHGLCLHWHLGR